VQDLQSQRETLLHASDAVSRLPRSAAAACSPPIVLLTGVRIASDQHVSCTVVTLYNARYRLPGLEVERVQLGSAERELTLSGRVLKMMSRTRSNHKLMMRAVIVGMALLLFVILYFKLKSSDAEQPDDSDGTTAPAFIPSAPPAPNRTDGNRTDGTLVPRSPSSSDSQHSDRR
jgi:hypothetical protein